MNDEALLWLFNMEHRPKEYPLCIVNANGRRERLDQQARVASAVRAASFKRPCGRSTPESSAMRKLARNSVGGHYSCDVRVTATSRAHRSIQFMLKACSVYLTRALTARSSGTVERSCAHRRSERRAHRNRAVSRCSGGKNDRRSLRSSTSRI
jgi:hypothetical protein